MDGRYYLSTPAASGALTPKTTNYEQHSPNSLYPNSPEDAISRILTNSKPRSRQALSRLAFWKKQPPTASTVEHAIESASKAHKRYIRDLEVALETLQEWSANPPTIHKDILNLQEYEVCDRGYTRIQILVDAIKPVVKSERLMAEFTNALSHGFHAISEQEHNLQESQNRFNFALHRYHKSLPKGPPGEVLGQINDEIKRQGKSITTDVDNLYMAVNLQLLLPFRQLTTYLVDSASKRSWCQNLIHNSMDYTNDEREIGFMHTQFHSSPCSAEMHGSSPNSGLRTEHSQINKIRAKDVDNYLGPDLFPKSGYGLSGEVPPLRMGVRRPSRSSSANSMTPSSVMINGRRGHSTDGSQEMLSELALPSDGAMWSHTQL